jgi:hypothetical protein
MRTVFCYFMATLPERWTGSFSVPKRRSGDARRRQKPSFYPGKDAVSKPESLVSHHAKPKQPGQKNFGPARMSVM